MSECLVGAAVVTFNSGPHIQRCLASLAEDPLVGEAVVVDNGSSDETCAIVRDFNDGRLSVKLLVSADNPGFGTSTNRAAAELGSDFILVLNPDAALTAGALALLLDPAQDADVGVVGPRLERENGQIDPACARRLPTLRNSVFHMLPVFRRFSNYRAPDADGVEALCGACMLVRRSVFNDLGGFDTEFWMYGEDLDFCARVAASGRRVVYISDALVLHSKGGSSGEIRAWKVNWEFYRALWLYYRKHLCQDHNVLIRSALWVVIMTAGGLAGVQNTVRRLRRREDHGKTRGVPYS